jgi:hypothetical protein
MLSELVSGELAVDAWQQRCLQAGIADLDLGELESKRQSGAAGHTL